MPQSTRLLAWVEPRGDRAFLAAFVGGAAATRRPATQLCDSPELAREWVEDQAAEVGLPVEWLEAAPPQSRRASSS
jgi:hypothetical protein